LRPAGIAIGDEAVRLALILATAVSIAPAGADVARHMAAAAPLGADRIARKSGQTPRLIRFPFLPEMPCRPKWQGHALHRDSRDANP
jgi:hypothetical protein